MGRGGNQPGDHVVGRDRHIGDFTGGTARAAFHQCQCLPGGVAQRRGRGRAKGVVVEVVGRLAGPQPTQHITRGDLHPRLFRFERRQQGLHRPASSRDQQFACVGGQLLSLGGGDGGDQRRDGLGAHRPQLGESGRALTVTSPEGPQFLGDERRVRGAGQQGLLGPIDQRTDERFEFGLLLEAQQGGRPQRIAQVEQVGLAQRRGGEQFEIPPGEIDPPQVDQLIGRLDEFAGGLGFDGERRLGPQIFAGPGLAEGRFIVLSPA